MNFVSLRPVNDAHAYLQQNPSTRHMPCAGAFYLRLVGRPVEVYQYLEPLYNDYRKVRLRHADGSFGLTHMDEVVDQLLNNEYLFDIALPRIPNRSAEATGIALRCGPALSWALSWLVYPPCMIPVSLMPMGTGMNQVAQSAHMKHAPCKHGLRLRTVTAGSRWSA